MMIGRILKFSLTMSLLGGLLAACQTNVTQRVDGIRRDKLVADPERAAKARIALAAEFLRQGNLDQAQQSAEKALEAEPRSAEAHNIMALIFQTEGSARNLAQAEAYFKRALALGRDSPQINNNYGAFLYQQGRYQEAYSYLNRAATTLGYDNRAGALENQGMTLIKLGQPDQAEQSFQQALRIEPALLLARQGMAEILLRRNDVAGASRLYADIENAGVADNAPDRLWLGIKLARAQRNVTRQNELVDRLRTRFPVSAEYQKYLKLQATPGAIWD